MEQPATQISNQKKETRKIERMVTDGEKGTERERAVKMSKKDVLRQPILKRDEVVYMKGVAYLETPSWRR